MTLPELISRLWQDQIPLRLSAERRLALDRGWDWNSLPAELQRAIQEHRKALEMEIALGGPMAARLRQLVCGECHPEVKPNVTSFDRDQTYFCCRCQWATGHYPRMREDQLRAMRGLSRGA